MADSNTASGGIKFIYTLCRHGLTQANSEGIIQGQQDVPLSAVGEEQAEALGKRLATETFTHIYASDLARAKSTAEAVARSSSVGDAVPITTDTRIRERNFGNFEGKYLSEFRGRTKDTNLPMYLCAPDHTVETIETFMGRTVSFFKDVCSTITKQTTPSTKPIKSSLLVNDAEAGEPPVAHVLAAVHGGVIRMHLMYFESLRFYIPGSTTRSTPNTAISSFLVTIDKEGNLCDAKCLCLHDNSHVANCK